MERSGMSATRQPRAARWHHGSVNRATILVSGAPGAGKTSLAVPLAAALGYSLLSKDHIKETLHDSLAGPAGDLQWSRRIGGASMELLWTLATRCPYVVLEANFRPHSDYQRGRLRQLPGRLVEVYCDCPPATCARRYARRAAAGAHATHVIRELSPEQLAEFDGPVAVGPVIRVDTTTPVDVPAVAAAVRERLGGLHPAAVCHS
jgi:predicted kinase